VLGFDSLLSDPGFSSDADSGSIRLKKQASSDAAARECCVLLVMKIS
jgi:hypothetical protein